MPTMRMQFVLDRPLGRAVEICAQGARRAGWTVIPMPVARPNTVLLRCKYPLLSLFGLAGIAIGRITLACELQAMDGRDCIVFLTASNAGFDIGNSQTLHVKDRLEETYQAIMAMRALMP